MYVLGGYGNNEGNCFWGLIPTTKEIPVNKVEVMVTSLNLYLEGRKFCALLVIYNCLEESELEIY